MTHCSVLTRSFTTPSCETIFNFVKIFTKNVKIIQYPSRAPVTETLEGYYTILTINSSPSLEAFLMFSAPLDCPRYTRLFEQSGCILSDGERSVLNDLFCPRSVTYYQMIIGGICQCTYRSQSFVTRTPERQSNSSLFVGNLLEVIVKDTGLYRSNLEIVDVTNPHKNN